MGTKLFGGLDWSGTPTNSGPTSRPDLYVPCVVAVESLNKLSLCLSDLRVQLGWAATKEFHGHDCSEYVQAAVLRETQSLNLRVCALIIDKRPAGAAVDLTPVPVPAEFMTASALAVLGSFIERYQLRKLWIDEDIKNAERRREFEAATRRIHRRRWPDARLTIRHRCSTQADLIQLADTVAYGLSRLTVGAIEDPELRSELEGIRMAPGNIVRGPAPWKG